MQTNFTTSILFTAAQQSEYILCTYSVAYPITPPPISIWVELTRKQKLSSLKYIPYIHIASSNQKETTISATQHKMMYCTSRMPSYRPIHPDSIAAPYDIRLLEHRQIGNMALKSRPLLSYGVRSCPATGISRKPRYTPRRPVRAALYRL